MHKQVVAAEKIVKSLGLEVKEIDDLEGPSKFDDDNDFFGTDGSIMLNNGYEIQVGPNYFAINIHTGEGDKAEIEWGDELKTQKALKAELEKLKPAIVA